MGWSVIAIGSEGPRGRSLKSDVGGSLLEEKKPSAGGQTGKSWFRSERVGPIDASWRWTMFEGFGNKNTQ